MRNATKKGRIQRINRLEKRLQIERKKNGLTIRNLQIEIKRLEEKIEELKNDKGD